MPRRTRVSSREREQLIIDRAERIAALRLIRILTADGALPLGVVEEGTEPDKSQVRNGGQDGSLITTVYIEPRPKGRPEGTPIADFVVEDHANHVLYTAETQQQAIDWAKRAGHRPHVARVRDLNDKKVPDHWREV
jgi:hypothetical protein